MLEKIRQRLNVNETTATTSSTLTSNTQSESETSQLNLLPVALMKTTHNSSNKDNMNKISNLMDNHKKENHAKTPNLHSKHYTR